MDNRRPYTSEYIRIRNLYIFLKLLIWLVYEVLFVYGSYMFRICLIYVTVYLVYELFFMCRSCNSKGVGESFT